MRALWMGIAVSLAVAGSPAHADEAPVDVDVDRSEYLDVIAVKDGSVWKGVIVEQTPGVDYKIVLAGGSVHVVRADEVVSIRKERNPRFQAAPGGPAATPSAIPSREARRPTGAFVGAGVTLAIPAGDLVADDADTGVSPGFVLRGGFRYRRGNLSAQLGARARFVYWDIPGSPYDAFMWTLEMHAFARAARRSAQLEPFLGLSLGPDFTSYDFSFLGDGAGFGLGATVDAGVILIATDAIDVDLEVSYHPPLSPIPYSDGGAKVSYVGLALAGSWHL